jgi:integrase
MPSKIRFLLHRDGRYYARKVVPKQLQAAVGKTELRVPLGPDRRAAIIQLPAALVMIDAMIDDALRASQHSGDSSTAAVKPAVPMDLATLARTHYAQRLAFDEALRNAGPQYASVGVDDVYVSDLRATLAGHLADEKVDQVVGRILRRFEHQGYLIVKPRSPEWRGAARAVADAELHFLARMIERDEGVPASTQQHPAHLVSPEAREPQTERPPPISLRGLLESHIQHLESEGRGREVRRSWPPIFDNLIAFLRSHRKQAGRDTRGVDDARELTTEELIMWRDELLKTLNPKTVKDVRLAAVKAVLGRAVEDRKLPNNPAQGVKVRSSRRTRHRDPGYTDEEAKRILEACRRYEPPARDNPANRESAQLTAAKRWGPWLCAFTGARVGEVLQLRKSDVREKAGIPFVLITPEAGTTKDRKYREVPLHRQLTELGFLDFVKASPEGPLFCSRTADPAKLPARVTAGRLSTWLRKSGLAPRGVAPNHGWRHRFKSQSIELGINPRIYDAIQGHVGRTASDDYGTVSLRAKKEAVERLPRYEI